jgi:Kef-type K+ transport system membrane component KefB
VKHPFLFYPAVIGLFVLSILGVLHVGSRLPAAPPAPTDIRPGVADENHIATAPSQPESAAPDGWTRRIRQPQAILFLQLIVIVLVARVCGAVATRAGQPAVVGEIAAGIFLGPSFLGWIAPDVSSFLFQPSSLGTLQLLSQIGVILFMFVVGLELDLSHVRLRAHTAVAVSHVSIVFPFLLGALASLALFAPNARPGVPFHAFALFMGIAMSITAFPVLARILDERGLSRTPIGSTAITCAAVDDVTAWTLLAFVVAVVTAGGALSTLLIMIAVAVAFVVTMLYGVRPLLGRLLDPKGRHSALSRERTAIVLGVLFASALATELIGIHALFGAFVAGASMPRDSELRVRLRERLESFSSVFLLPLFFAFTGLRTEIGLLDTPRAWLICGGIIALATVGKLVGTTFAARWTGMDWRNALVLGALMNTRGLMELIALNVGYDLGILSPGIFAMMVIMALVTTALTGPLIHVIDAVHWRTRGQPPAPLAQAGSR